MTLKMVVAVSAALVLLVSACATEEEAPQATATPAATPSSVIDVSLVEYSVTPKPDVGKAGEITFTVDNKGTEEHEFVVAASDLDPGKLPTIDDGSVDEDKLDIKGEVEELATGKGGKVKLELTAGTYVLFCNLVDEPEEHEEHESDILAHYKLGMRTAFTVE